jgi:glutathione S-transferase
LSAAIRARNAFSAADCVLYPGLAWLKRALSKSARKDLAALLVEGRAATDAWAARIEAVPGFDGTYPPHWR